MNNEMISELYSIGLIPVIKIENPDDAVPLALIECIGFVKALRPDIFLDCDHVANLLFFGKIVNFPCYRDIIPQILDFFKQT